MIMKEYFLTCKDALEAKLLRLLEDRQHYVENSDYYSIQVSRKRNKSSTFFKECNGAFCSSFLGSHRHLQKEFDTLS